MPLSPIARRALEAEMPDLIGGPLATRYGWKAEMDWESGLMHVTLTCPYRMDGSEASHTYCLQLTFDRYPLEQPGVRFVDPATRAIGEAGTFERWWPNIDGNPWINIQINTNEPSKSYLCFQWTQEFRQTHSPPEATDPKRWDPEKHNAVGVIRYVQRALNSGFYRGYRKQ